MIRKLSVVAALMLVCTAKAANLRGADDKGACRLPACLDLSVGRPRRRAGPTRNHSGVGGDYQAGQSVMGKAAGMEVVTTGGPRGMKAHPGEDAGMSPWRAAAAVLSIQPVALEMHACAGGSGNTNPTYPPSQW